MITSRKVSIQSARAWLLALSLATGLGATAASAAPVFGPPDPTAQAGTTLVQYWGDHGGWGHHRHHDGPRYESYGHHQRDGWGHRRHHDWGHQGGWDHHRRHHRHHHGHYDN